jgi:hypothetical protein
MTRYNPRLVPEFLSRHPTVEGYTLICVLEHINRIVKGDQGILYFLEVARTDQKAADYLVRVCEGFQAQKSA